MNILFVTSSRIGDAVLSTGLLAHLTDRHPAARITIVCGPISAPLFTAVPNLDGILALEKRCRGAHWFTMWRHCIGRRWDLVVDLRDSPAGRLLFARARRVKTPNRGPGHTLEHLAKVLNLAYTPSPGCGPRPSIGPQPKRCCRAVGRCWP